MRCGSAAIALSLTFGLCGGARTWAQAPAAPPAAASPSWQLSGSWLTRWESWRYFEPPPTGGDPTYAFLGNRARLGLRGRVRRVEIDLTVQYVPMQHLPERASNPGAFGTGSLYFDQGGRRVNSQELWLRYAHVRLPGLAAGLDVQAGRMPYTSGAEAPSGQPKIETVKRQRLDARLVGEFEWSIYQRGFDGVRLDYTRPSWKATALAALPTQGGFARVSGPTITDILVTGATFSTRSPAQSPRRTQVQGFGWYYNDARAVTQRPDNTGLSAPRADIALSTFGAVALGAYDAGAGEVDVLGWSAVQGGNWYGQGHQAYAVALEGGYQWTSAPVRPWIRAGFFRASGDQDAADDRHGTFFPMLPTVRRFSQTTVYSTMNLNDAFVSLQGRPRPSVALRLDVRRLDLASSNDLWYAGSGATLGSGSVFGYVGRRSNGATYLGTAVEGSADLTLSPHLNVNGFIGTIGGGPVVTGTFAGDRLWFGYLEAQVSFATLLRKPAAAPARSRRAHSEDRR